MENKAQHSKGACFLKVLDGDFSKQLPIPPAFTKYFNSEIPKWLIIEIAGTRKCWRVDVEDDGTGALYFSDGWDDFVKSHALEVGNILLFQFKGQLILEVVVFDKDGCEKPIGQTSEFEAYTLENSECQHRSSNAHHAEEASRLSTMTHNAQEKWQQGFGSIKRRAPGASVTENGMGFSLTLKDNKRFYYYMTIPRAAAIKMKLPHKDEIVLKDKEGNDWPVKLITRPDGRVDMTRGWSSFLRANKMTAGATLNFVFCSDNLLQVNAQTSPQVVHPPQNASQCINNPAAFINMAFEHVEPVAICSGNYQAPEASGNAERVHSGFRKSSFCTIWKETSKGSYLNIPKRVAVEQNLLNDQTLVLCDQEGNDWQVGVKIKQNDGRFNLTHGWSEFRRGHEIKAGDTLIFEFISVGMVKVSIVRGSQPNRAIDWVDVKQEALAMD